MFGGGLAAIPFLQQMGDKTGWFTTVELMDIIAISEATPGPIGVNMATYAGFTVAGVPGGIVATIGLIMPSVIIAMIVARLLVRFRESKYVDSALYGLRAASLGLIAAAGATVFFFVIFGVDVKNMIYTEFILFDLRAFIMAAALFILTNKLKFHPIVFLAASAFFGIFFLN